MAEFGVRLQGGPPENGEGGPFRAATSDVGWAGSPEDGGASISGAASDPGGLGWDPGGRPPSISGAGVSAPKSGGASQECRSTSMAQGLCAGNV